MPPDVSYDALSKAFRILRVARLGSVPPPGLLKRVLKTLESTFITVERIGEIRVIRFANPSIRDFVLDYLSAEPDEFEALIVSAAFFDQAVLLARYAGVIESRPQATAGTELARPALRLVGTTKSDVVANALVRTLDAGSCGVTMLRAGGIRLARAPNEGSVERRLATVVNALGIARSVNPVWLEEQTKRVEASWRSGRGDKDGAVELIEAMDRLGGESLRGPLARTAKEWFVTTLERSQDLAAVVALRAAEPATLSGDDWDDVAAEAEAVIASEFEDALDNAASVDELDTRIEELGALIDYYGLSNTLIDDDRVDECRRELETSIEDDAWDDDESARERMIERESEERAIDDLFSTLAESESAFASQEPSKSDAA